jgi:hypothetical protein
LVRKPFFRAAGSYISGHAINRARVRQSAVAEHLFGMRDTLAADDIAFVVVARAVSGDVRALEPVRADRMSSRF